MEIQIKETDGFVFTLSHSTTHSIHCLSCLFCRPRSRFQALGLRSLSFTTPKSSQFLSLDLDFSVNKQNTKLCTHIQKRSSSFIGWSTTCHTYMMDIDNTESIIQKTLTKSFHSVSLSLSFIRRTNILEGTGTQTLNNVVHSFYHWTI